MPLENVHHYSVQNMSQTKTNPNTEVDINEILYGVSALMELRLEFSERIAVNTDEERLRLYKEVLENTDKDLAEIQLIVAAYAKFKRETFRKIGKIPEPFTPLDII